MRWHLHRRPSHFQQRLRQWRLSFLLYLLAGLRQHRLRLRALHERPGLFLSCQHDRGRGQALRRGLLLRGWSICNRSVYGPGRHVLSRRQRHDVRGRRRVSLWLYLRRWNCGSICHCRHHPPYALKLAFGLADHLSRGRSLAHDAVNYVQLELWQRCFPSVVLWPLRRGGHTPDRARCLGRQYLRLQRDGALCISANAFKLALEQRDLMRGLHGSDV